MTSSRDHPFGTSWRCLSLTRRTDARTDRPTAGRELDRRTWLATHASSGGRPAAGVRRPVAGGGTEAAMAANDRFQRMRLMRMK
jgi:hypothetical protein